MLIACEPGANLLKQYLKGGALQTLKELFKKLGLVFTRQALEKSAPFGIGVVLGAVGDYALTRYVGIQAKKWFILDRDDREPPAAQGFAKVRLFLATFQSLRRIVIQCSGQSQRMAHQRASSEGQTAINEPQTHEFDGHTDGPTCAKKRPGSTCPQPGAPACRAVTLSWISRTCIRGPSRERQGHCGRRCTPGGSMWRAPRVARIARRV